MWLILWISFLDELHYRDERLNNILLTAYARGMGEALSLPSRTSDSLRKQQQWHQALLSNICRWRACLDDALDSGKRTLCQHHTELKYFLDARQKLTSKSTSNIPISSLESTKYLPRKPAELSEEEMKRIKSSLSLQQEYDLNTMRAASTLITEIFDGNLKSTVHSFSKYEYLSYDTIILKYGNKSYKTLHTDAYV